MKNTLSFLSIGAALLSTLFLAPEARAGGLDACSDIFVHGDASCEVLVESDCSTKCEPPAFTASCATVGAVECTGGCSVEAEVECTTSCQTSCQTECEVDPGSFDCRATCEGGCSSNCSASCAADGNSAECEASCDATCSIECGASCEVTPPEVECMTECESCCSGQCSAEINLECQIDCQSDLYVVCRADLESECETRCSDPKGALFCDGQFIAISDIEECANALEDELDVHVEFHLEAEASASADGLFDCSVADEPAGGGLLGFGALCLLALGLRRKQS